MSVDGQRAIDERNRAFWNELCGTVLAQSLGITEITPASLARFDVAYLDYYPYLARYLEELPVKGRRVLEIGLGFGTVGQSLAARGALYHGADIAPGPVAVMQDRLRWLGKAEESTAASGLGARTPVGRRDVRRRGVDRLPAPHRRPAARGERGQSGAGSRRRRPGHALQRALVPAADPGTAAALAGIPDRPERRRERAGDVRREHRRRSRAAHGVLSRRQVRRLFKGFSAVSIEAQNFDPLRLHLGRRAWWIPRERMLGNIARVLGLDLYIRARK